MASSPGARGAISLQNLPAEALRLVAQNLRMSDKKSLALTCAAMPPIIRSIWTAIVVDMSSEDRLPRRLSSFSAVSTIVVADLPPKPPSAIAASTQPAFFGENYEGQVYKVMHDAGQRLGRVIATLQTATTLKSPNSSGGVKRPNLSLQIALPRRETSSHLQFPVHCLFNKKTMQEIRILALQFLGSSISSSHMRALLAFDHLDLSPEDGSTYCAFDNIDADWFIPDGHLIGLITKGTAPWVAAMPADQFQLELYTRLHTLRLCVAGCAAEKVTPSIFPKVNALQGLRELYLENSSAGGNKNIIEMEYLNLPALTRLVISNGFHFHSFSSFTHLQQLQELSVDVRHLFAAGEHPQNISSLSSLSNLSDLYVSQLYVAEPQSIHLLQQLSSLSLYDVHGFVKLLQPMAPMPKLRHFLLLESLDVDLYLLHVIMNDIRGRNIEDIERDGEIISWIMDNAATTFPNIEELSLRMESIKQPLSKDFDVNLGVEAMDARVRKILLDAPYMKKFTMHQALSHEASFLAKFPDGAVAPSFLSGELHVERRLYESTKWQRDIAFIETIPIVLTRRQQISYIFTRKEG